MEAAKMAKIGHWITRDGNRIYFDTDGNEYTGSAAMRRYRKDQGIGQKKNTGTRRRKKRTKRRRSRR